MEALSSITSKNDKNTYERHTIITMELMSSYFINIFYNELYVVAKQRCETRESPTITDGYKHALQAWINSLDKPHLYKRTIRGLYDYYMHYTSYIKSWDDCIDDMVREFVPDGYLEALTKNQKMNILSIVIKNSNMGFIKCIVQKHFPIIIDSHTGDNAQVLKDEMIGILLLEREHMYQRFIIQATGTKSNSSPDKAIIERLQKKVQTLLKEKFELNKRIIQMRRIILKNKTHEAPQKLTTSSSAFDISEMSNILKAIGDGESVAPPAQLPTVEHLPPPAAAEEAGSELHQELRDIERLAEEADDYVADNKQIKKSEKNESDDEESGVDMLIPSDEMDLIANNY